MILLSKNFKVVKVGYARIKNDGYTEIPENSVVIGYTRDTVLSGVIDYLVYMEE